MDFVFLDTETTGIEENDEVIQLAYVVVKGGKKIPMNKYYKPTVPIKYKAMATHHITPEVLEKKNAKERLSMSDVLMRGLEKINNQDTVLVAHNAKFDIGMLAKHGFSPKMQLIDTLRCAKHLLDDAKEGHSLGVLYYQYDLYRGMEELAKELNVDYKTLSSHDALFDVMMLILVTRMLLRVAGSPEKLVELTFTPVFIKEFPFGKYRGQLIEEVAKTDMNYLKWMLGNMADLDDDMRFTLETIMGGQ